MKQAIALILIALSVKAYAISTNPASNVTADSAATPLTIPYRDANGSFSMIAGDIDTAKLATDSVDTAKIARDAVATAEILNGAVDTTKIKADSVDTTKILTGSVDTTKLLGLQSSVIDTMKVLCTRVGNSKGIGTCSNSATMLGGCGNCN